MKYQCPKLIETRNDKCPSTFCRTGTGAQSNMDFGRAYWCNSGTGLLGEQGGTEFTSCDGGGSKTKRANVCGYGVANKGSANLEFICQSGVGVITTGTGCDNGTWITQRFNQACATGDNPAGGCSTGNSPAVL